MHEELFERNSRYLRERNMVWKERDRYKWERDILLLGMAEHLDIEARESLERKLDDAEQLDSGSDTPQGRAP